MAVDSTQVIAGRDFGAYSADWASTNTMPADTVAYGAISSPYTNVGYTTGGLRFSAGIERTDVRVDQSFDPILRIATARSITMGTTLAQFSPANVKSATGMGTITTVAAGSGTRGHDDLVIGESLTEQFKTFIMEILNPHDQEAIRIALWKAMSAGNIEATFSADGNPAGIALDLTGTPDTSASPTRIATIRDVIPAA